MLGVDHALQRCDARRIAIKERHAHALYISRYPVGLDATVYGTVNRGQNVVFVNDMDTPIYIRGIRQAQRGDLRDLGNRRRSHREAVEAQDQEQARGGMYYEYTNDLEPGERREVYDNYDAFQSS